MLVICVLLIGAFVVPSIQSRTPIRNMTITHVWNNLEYGFDSQSDYDYAISSGIYSEEGFKTPYDVDVSVSGKKKVRFFISSPKVVPSVPYSISKISNDKGKYGPILLPFPNFKAHSERDTPGCERIISVFRIFVDRCNRLWAVDTGRNFQVTPTQVCPPKILIFDLNTDKLIRRYEIPEDQYIPEKSVHNGIVVDIYDPPPKGRCHNGKAYLTDARGYLLVVYDLQRNTSWVISNELFKPDPAYTTTTIAGESFLFADGLYTSAPDLRKNVIFFHSYASRNEFYAPLSLVNNQALWIHNSSANQDIFKVIGSRQTQSPTEAVDSKGLIYTSIHEPLSIFSYSPSKPYEVSNFKTVVENPDTLQFVAGMKVKINSKAQEILLVLSNRLQKRYTGTISQTEENYRVMTCETSVLQRGKGECGSV